ncbi:MAG: hypothetical protein EOQ39_22280 [Mesorhizobium sp.]|uniref:hypothetical protein n=1 Tax=Mesorhizobium sp. TaxID=1871066 RepID=UPI000FE99C97|nr:hypothetical protein [Mesorhizobium sp.]RWB05492.1 MAG: hypothetical protein EOQ37_14630 [Mesorhizobium sp.]RWB12537.1 MAG: hypothetical protein EOQ39_22280 [Mesorhizobium sp.]RWN15786.1 MAG: hypothetical protein EOR94_21770 [Mesorhizobium sp.]
MVVSIGETFQASFIVSIGIWLLTALKTRIYNVMPGRLMDHTGHENFDIAIGVMIQQQPTIFTLIAFILVGLIYCFFAAFTLSYFQWSQGPWYDQMASEIFQLPRGQEEGLFWVRVFFGVVTVPVFFVIIAGLYQLAKVGLWLVFW